MKRHASARNVCLPVLALVALAGCGGGGGDDASDEATGTPIESVSAATSSQGDGGSDVPANDASATPTLSAEPGQAWAEVDGERLVYESNRSLYYTCDVGGDAIVVNFQTAHGHDLSIQAALQGGGWVGQMFFKPAGRDNVVYSTSLGSGDGVLGVADDEISYVGTVTRVEGTDLANAQDLDAEVAVNCASAGGDPAAVIDGENYEFPAGGAQSFDCTVAPDRVLVRVNRLSTDGRQLEIDAREEGGTWIGAVVVYDVDDTFSSTVEPDGSGLEIDGNSVSYTGTFAGQDGVEVAGSAEVTCP